MRLRPSSSVSEQERGFVLGAAEDGIVYHRPEKNEWGLEIDQLSEAWLQTVQKALKSAYNKSSRVRKTSKGYWRLNVYSKSLYEELHHFRKRPALILKQQKAFQKGYLQGIFDAEGSIRAERKHITVSSNKPATIRVVLALLKNLAINIGKPHKDKNNVISIPFYGKENLKLFSKKIGFRHPEKLRRLELLAT